MLQLVATVVTVQQKSKVKESVYLLFNTALARLFCIKHDWSNTSCRILSYGILRSMVITELK